MRAVSQHSNSTGTGGAHARAALTLASLLAWAALQIVSGGCTPKPSSVSMLSAPHAPAAEAGSPAIACDPVKHDVLMSWLAGDSTEWRIWFSRSSDRGASWSTPVAVSPPGEPLRRRREASPRMVCDGEGHVGIAWATSVSVPGWSAPASDLRFARSIDGGAHWEAPVTVNDDTANGPGNHAFHDVAMRAGGNLSAAWLDSRPGADSLDFDRADGADASVHFARSGDFGAHWGPNSAQWSHVCSSCRVSLVVDPAGFMYAAFRKRYPGDIRDIVLARPGGPPVRAHEDGWHLDYCPQAGPSLALSRDGTLRVAWYTGAPGRVGVWFRQGLPERMDSTVAPIAVLLGDKLPVVRIGIAEAGMSGTLIACDADSTGGNQLTLARIEASGRRLVERFVVPDTRGVTHPRVASTFAGRTAYVAWTSHVGARTELRFARWDVGR